MDTKPLYFSTSFSFRLDTVSAYHVYFALSLYLFIFFSFGWGYCVSWLILIKHLHSCISIKIVYWYALNKDRWKIRRYFFVFCRCFWHISNVILLIWSKISYFCWKLVFTKGWKFNVFAKRHHTLEEERAKKKSDAQHKFSCGAVDLNGWAKIVHHNWFANKKKRKLRDAISSVSS